MKKNGQKELVKLYKHLDHSESADFRNENLADFVIEKMKKGSVLDVGCGSGLVVIKSNLKGHDVSVGVDIETDLLNIARKKSRKLKAKTEFKKISITRLSKSLSKKFDNIVCLDVLEHIDNDNAALKQLFLSLKSNGRLLIAVPAHPFLYGKKDESIGHFRRYTKFEIIEKIKKAGFKVISGQYWNFLGFFVYLAYEKILGTVVNESMRYKSKSKLHYVFQKIIFSWVKNIENKIVFPIGLSYIVVATKK